MACPNNHTLSLSNGIVYICDLCKREFPAIQQSYNCRPCDYDICGLCYNDPSKQKGTITRDKLCNNGHQLLQRTGTAYVCDVCHANHPNTTSSFRCDQCDYDLCQVCFANPTKGNPGQANRALPQPVVPLPAASIEEVRRSIDAATKGTGFSCKSVSWEDAQRGTVGGSLSCWGGNISDVRLWERSGKKLLYTVRSDNWNERIGYVSAKEVAVVVGNHVPGGSPPTPVTLQSYLENASSYTAYAKATPDGSFVVPNHPNRTGEEVFSVRFQTVFLPVATNEPMEFCTEVYNYNTHDDSDPRNMLLLCTAQGTAVQQDGSGAKKLFTHEVDRSGTIHRYWLEGEKSSHKVGGQQQESQAEAEDAARRGKSTAIHIGTRAMGTRFNVQMMVQLPLVQKPKPQRNYGGGMFGGGGGGYPTSCLEMCAPPPCSASYAQGCALDDSDDDISHLRRRTSAAAPRIGQSSAARVSRGKEEDSTWPGVSNKVPKRDPQQHGTITITMYYTVTGGVPSPDDIKAAIDDLNNLYASCPKEMRLAQATEITKELTVAQTNQINQKVTQQPYQPQTFAPANSAFPE